MVPKIFDRLKDPEYNFPKYRILGRVALSLAAFGIAAGGPIDHAINGNTPPVILTFEPHDHTALKPAIPSTTIQPPVAAPEEQLPTTEVPLPEDK